MAVLETKQKQNRKVIENTTGMSKFGDPEEFSVSCHAINVRFSKSLYLKNIFCFLISSGDNEISNQYFDKPKKYGFQSDKKSSHTTQAIMQ